MLHFYHTLHHSRAMRHSLWLLALCLLLTLQACHSPRSPHQPERIHYQGEAQGTYYSITYYDTVPRIAQSEIDSLLADFDLTASLWVEGSLLRRLNDNTTDTITPLFADLLTKSMEAYDYTDGAFDCTVGKLVNAWGFGFRKHEELGQHAVDSMLGYIGTNRLQLDTADNGTLLLRKGTPEIELDFNAIAQGYSVDMLADFFEAKGVHNYLIDVGGEVIGRGCKPGGEAWNVGIERPAPDRYSAPEIELSIALRDASVVTSGSYRKYYEKDGARYSHTIDPSTGRPVEHSLLSVSVVDRYAWRADALATAFMVMGLERSLAFIEAHPTDSQVQAVFFIYDDGGTYKTMSTPAFDKLINE